jgi:hypothetical protein
MSGRRRRPGGEPSTSPRCARSAMAPMLRTRRRNPCGRVGGRSWSWSRATASCPAPGRRSPVVWLALERRRKGRNPAEDSQQQPNTPFLVDLFTSRRHFEPVTCLFNYENRNWLRKNSIPCRFYRYLSDLWCREERARPDSADASRLTHRTRLGTPPAWQPQPASMGTAGIAAPSKARV